MYQLLKSFALPPFSLIILLILGLLFIHRARKKLGYAFALGSVALMLLLSMDFVGNYLIVLAQKYPALPPSALSNTDAEAIVVLAASANIMQTEFGRSTSDGLSLYRLRYGAFVQQRTNLPVLISGGPVRSVPQTVSSVLAEDLITSFGIQAKWLEQRSTNTHENAQYSAKILNKEGISTVFLVTDAFHMRRAVAEFEKTGVAVIPAPTGVTMAPQLRWRFFIPRMSGLSASYFAIHELLGQAWYSIRYSD